VSGELIALSGANGEVGSRIATRLAAMGAHQRLVVRDASRAPALQGAEVRVASGYAAVNEMRAALEGTHTFLLIPGSETATRAGEHMAAVDGAVAAGVERIVYLSFVGATADSTFTLARDHYATEQHIRASGIPFTFLRMNLYLDFIVRWWLGPDGVIKGPAGDGRTAALLRDDIADAAAAVLISEHHNGQTYDLTGREAFTLTEATDVMSRVSGKAITFRSETVDEAYESRSVYGAPEWQVAGWVTSYTALAAGQMAPITDFVRVLTGHKPLTLAEYLDAHPGCLDHVTSG
jgi:NAD(P)H dehydrogenase (quinone)